MNVKREVREKARDMRRQGLSVRNIARLLDVSKGSVSVWVRDIGLLPEQLQALKENQRRYAAQNRGARANRAKFRNLRLSYQEAGRVKAREGHPLHLAGCMLFWAEGAKDSNRLYFVNSDANMLCLFMRFLREELAIQEHQMKLYVHCHTTDADQQCRIAAYWLDLLNLPETCFQKVLVKKGSETSRNVLPNGICSVRVYNVKVIQHIYGAIQEYAGFDNPDWLF